MKPLPGTEPEPRDDMAIRHWTRRNQLARLAYYTEPHALDSESPAAQRMRRVRANRKGTP